MASKLVQTNPHEAENLFEITLRQSFEILKPNLIPPFPLTIPSPSAYLDLNRAILFALLTDPQFTKLHITHLHAIVTDAYKFFVSLITKLVFESYTKLIDSVKVQLICVTRKLVEVSAVGIEELLFCLLRQIVGGDYGDGNLWLCVELLRVFMDNWDWLVEEPFVLTSAVFTYLRLLADHYRLSGGRFQALKRLEIEFCVRVLRNHFDLCLQIGRDLVRLLQDLVYIPEFKAIWKDLLLNPSEFRTQGFSDISQLYCLRTSSKYLLLRITPEMETQLRFFLTHVKWGFHRRYQLWFAKKFLSTSESETLIPDIVRFICCAIHPSNEIIQSNVIPRWATIGWLLTCCRSAQVEANTKLALLYDWMFYNERVDRIMNIEPGVLLMVHSIPQYIDVTRTLLEFLFHLVDSYDDQRKDVIAQGVSTAFSVLVRAGVVRSVDVFSSCPLLSPFLKAKLVKISSKSFPAAHLPHRSVPIPNLANASNTESQMSLPTKLTPKDPKDIGTQVNPNRSPVNIMEDLVNRLGECLKISYNLGLRLLEELLFSFANFDSQSMDVGAPVGSILNPETLGFRVTEIFKSNGYDMFVPFKHPLKSNCGDHNQSATPLVLCTFMFCQNRRTQELLLFWSRKGYPVGPHFLYYASLLAYESHKIGCSISPDGENKLVKVSESETPFLKYHIDKYVSFNRDRGKDYLNVRYCASSVDSKHIIELIQGAFASYRSVLISGNNGDASLAQLIFSDLMSCCELEKNRLKELLWSIFCYLPDLTTGKEEFIHSLVEKLDYADLIILQFEISLENFSVFGKDIEMLFQLIKSSLSWGFPEQQKFWALMVSEQANSKVKVERLVADFFSLEDLDPNVHSIAIGGLFTLCSRRVPSPDFVCSMISLPDNVIEGFAASVLANWFVSNGSKLFNCLDCCLENRGKDDTSPFFCNTGVRLNRSTITRFLEFLDKQEMECTDYMSNLSVISVRVMKVKLADAKVQQKSFDLPDDNVF
ncbi:hypothetical protein ACHQM5_017484 [Ranunculus cassubicifolius]